jgi:hypothetical protein
MYPTRMSLPIFGKVVSKTTFESPTYFNVPQCIEPVPVTDEKNIMEIFIQELNTNFMTELAMECLIDREGGEHEQEQCDTRALKGKRFVLVGASHASRLACAMEDMNVNVVDLSSPGWRVSPAAVNTQCEQLARVLKEKFDGETIIIYQLFDNRWPVTQMACVQFPREVATTATMSQVDWLLLGGMSSESSSRWHCHCSEQV